MSKKQLHSQLFRSMRRDVLKMMALSSTALSTPFIITPSQAASKKITVRDPGGIVARLYKKIFYEPFTQATGIQVASAMAEPDPIAQIRTIVETKNYLWDIANITQLATLILTSNDVYLEKHELEHDPVISSIPSQFISPYSVGTNVYATALVHRTDAFKERRVPQSWKDVWDIHHFPGRRALRKHPFDTIEIALMADGVSPEAIYPCDLDRAFRSLDKIKPHISVWWTSGPQTTYLLSANDIDLMPMWSTQAQEAIDANLPVAICEEGQIIGSTNWAILKGTPNADACRQFIKFASDPKRQALLTAHSRLGPTHPDAFHYIDPKRAKLMPNHPDNLKKDLFINAKYWAKNQNVAIERFNDWILS